MKNRWRGCWGENVRYFLLLLLFLLGGRYIQVHAQKDGTPAQGRLNALRVILAERLQDTLPPVFSRPWLPANARYEDGRIFLGTLQREFQTTGDTLSIIYHEYIHHLQHVNGDFPVAKDSAGQVLQWMTDTTFVFQPLPGEVERDLLDIRRKLETLTMPQLERHVEEEIKSLRHSMAQPQVLPFYYAPSNLARSELEAYLAQLEGEPLGLYVLSPQARALIRERVIRQRNILSRRIAYEKRHRLLPDGQKQPARP